ncbi:MAG: hypothetical protein LUH14_06210 [Clostridiaceae bacterium]|nr:hypothetical protein [Clostridiaceae bacterium]
MSGPWKGYEGYVTSTKPKTKDMKERQIIVAIEQDLRYGAGSRRISAPVSRDDIVDVNGDPMPKYSTQRELEMMECRKEQYGRLKAVMEEHGCDPYDYFHQTLKMSHQDVRKLESGEKSLDFYLDDDDCEELGVGKEWLMYGDEHSKEYPCGRHMKAYLNEHPERREIVWKWMQEDGYPLFDWYVDGFRMEYEEIEEDEDD